MFLQVVIDAITAGNTPAGLKARELCQAAGEALKEPTGDDEGAVPGSNPETRREGSPSAGMKANGQDPNTESTATVSGKHDVPTAAAAPAGKPQNAAAKPVPGKKEAQQPVAAPIEAAPETIEPPARKLSVSSSVAGDAGLYSCHLPEEILVEILDDRMQVLVFDLYDYINKKIKIFHSKIMIFT